MTKFRVLLLAGVWAVQPAFAAMLFTSQSDFFDATGHLEFEGFEDTAPGGTGSSRLLNHFILGPLSEDTFEPLEIINDPALAAEGEQSAGGNVRRIAFFAFYELNPTAVGFTLKGFGDDGPPDEFNIRLLNGMNTVAEIPLVSSTDPFMPSRFFGVVSPVPFTTVLLWKSSPDDAITVDAVYVGNAVPEPATTWLVGVGLAAVATLTRRRSRP